MRGGEARRGEQVQFEQLLYYYTNRSNTSKSVFLPPSLFLLSAQAKPRQRRIAPASSALLKSSTAATRTLSGQPALKTR